MPAEVISKAFDPFFTTKGVGKGTGLGLSQVFGFVRQSGGDVKINSEVNVGTSVRIYLPRHVGNEQTNRARTRNAVEAASSGEAIIVVEDEDRVCLMAVDALQELGYTVIAASDGREALRLI